jgi:hypothetical protein
VLDTAKATIIEILSERAGAQEAIVEIDGVSARAMNYPELTGPVKAGDEVLLNTTAVNLNLGTGGVHFVTCNLTRPVSEKEPHPGHIMKLRYTPLQHSVLAVEEDESPDQRSIREFETLDGMPVVCCELHSQVAPAAAAIKAASSNSRIAYVMTDGASLPYGFSRLAAQMREVGLIDAGITCGQAFGGEIETINTYTGLIAAKQVANADIAIVAQGPGNAGAGSKYGFSGIEQGEALNAAKILGGCAIAAVRMSFADTRERHRGISHHTRTILEKIAFPPVVIPIPELQEKTSAMVRSQLITALERGHEIRTANGESGLLELQRLGVKVRTMGRSIDEDREFFLAASAAGVVALAEGDICRS